jgi:hypothetical protein
MESLEPTLRLTRLGRFEEGFAGRLGGLSPAASRQAHASVLRAELLEKAAQSSDAFALATTLLRSKRLTTSDRSHCETVLESVCLTRVILKLDSLSSASRS